MHSCAKSDWWATPARFPTSEPIANKAPPLYSLGMPESLSLLKEMVMRLNCSSMEFTDCSSGQGQDWARFEDKTGLRRVLEGALHIESA